MNNLNWQRINPTTITATSTEATLNAHNGLYLKCDFTENSYCLTLTNLMSAWQQKVAGEVNLIRIFRANFDSGGGSSNTIAELDLLSQEELRTQAAGPLRTVKRYLQDPTNASSLSTSTEFNLLIYKNLLNETGECDHLDLKATTDDGIMRLTYSFKLQLLPRLEVEKVLGNELFAPLLRHIKNLEFGQRYLLEGVEKLGLCIDGLRELCKLESGGREARVLRDYTFDFKPLESIGLSAGSSSTGRRSNGGGKVTLGGDRIQTSMDQEANYLSKETLESINIISIQLKEITDRIRRQEEEKKRKLEEVERERERRAQAIREDRWRRHMEASEASNAVPVPGTGLNVAEGGAPPLPAGLAAAAVVAPQAVSAEALQIEQNRLKRQAELRAAKLAQETKMKEKKKKLF